MKLVVRTCAALVVIAGLLILAAPPTSAGIPPFIVDVVGTGVCLPAGQAEITWDAVVDVAGGPGTTIDQPVVPEGMTPKGGGAQAGVQFEGEQSGAATGAVTFDPFQQLVEASNESFPVSSQAIAVASGESGGTVVLDVTVLIYNALNPAVSVTVLGAGEAELPICAQPMTLEPMPGVSLDAETRPRFTG